MYFQEEVTLCVFLGGWGAVQDLCCYTSFYLVDASGGFSLVVVHGLLIAVASRCRAWALGCSGFSSCGMWPQ